MKNVQVHQSFVHHTVSSRLGRTSLSLGFIAVFAGCLLSGNLAQAQLVNLLYIPLTNAPSTVTQSFPSSTSLGGASITLSCYNGSSALTDLEGLTGSGVNGAANGFCAMCLTNGETGTATGSANSSGAANCAVDAADANLAFGTINNFIVTFWYNEGVTLSDASGLTLPRLFNLNAAGGNDDTANSIAVKFQLGNQYEFEVNNATTTTGNSYGAPANTASMGTVFNPTPPANKWEFFAVVYDGTNLYQYTGSDTAVATLAQTFNAPGLSVNLGSAPYLFVGNRGKAGTRGLYGWMEDFRFYTNGPATLGPNATVVENIRKAIAPKIPTITGIYPDGTALMQATNTLVFTASSASGFNLTNIDLVVNGVDVSSSCTFTPALPSQNVSVSYVGLPQQSINTAVMTANDAIGLVGSASVTFDTFNPTNFVVKAEEFDFNSGHFIDNPDYTATNGDPNSYYQLTYTEGVDAHKGQSTGDNQANDYRYDDGTGTDVQTPLITGELLSPERWDTNGVIGNHMIGNWSSAEWQNYTKTFPAGNYNVYARLSTSSGSTVNFDQVISGQGTSSQTLSRLGSFTLTGSGTFQWVPLTSHGTLAVVNLGGQNTVRATTGGGANANFFMLVPANPNLPTISNVYPDGQFLFENTNELAFTVSSPFAINTANIQVTLNGTNVSSSLAFGPTLSGYNVSYTGLQANQTYATVINVTDNNGGTASATLSIDTWNPVSQVEAEDFDFDPSLSALIGDTESFRYIDNSVPTAPLHAANNSYEGQVGDTYIDEQGNDLNNGLSPIQNAYAGATFSNYRTNDPCATTPVTDTARRQFVPGTLDYNVGFLGPGHWEQYTRTWPSGTYNLYARVASGANLGTLYSSWSQVIAGWGTVNQVTRHIGSFAIPSTGGYSSYFYTPLIDRFGNYAQLTLGGTNTFRDTHLVFNQTETANGAVYGLNINFYMLVAPRTDLPRIDNVYPNGFTLMQPTNTLSFVASSPTYGLNTSGITVTLNGNNITPSLVFSGSSPSYNVSYPGLQPNTAYSAVITVTDLNNQTHTTTVNFDTFSPNYYTWEAEDFDFDPALSPVPNGSGLRYLDNAALTSIPAANSYVEQQGDSGSSPATAIDYSWEFFNVLPIPTVYRTNDTIPIEVTGDTPRQKYLDAQLLQVNPNIQDYDIYNLTNNGWINYTRTFPSGSFLVYARLSAGNTLTNFQCAQVTSGFGTTMQVSNVLGYFQATGNGYATWQYAPLTSNGVPVILSLGGVETLQMTGDWNEHVNFFMLVSVVPTITASINGPNIVLSFPTISGANYIVQYKNNVTDPSWTQLGSQVTGNSSIQSVNDSLSQSQRFYRLAVQ